jgi:ParB-like chromosome segregation protein Spo0J
MAINLKSLATGRSEVFKLPIEAIAVEKGFNLRSDKERMAENVEAITASILAMGFRTDRPLTVQMIDGKAIIRDGHCRFEAAKKAKVDVIPCVSVPQHVGDIDLLVGQMVQPGMALTNLEYAQGVKKLMNHSLTKEDVAKRLGRSIQWVDNMLIADNAPPEIRSLIANGALAVTEAVKTIRQEGPLGAVIALTQASEVAKAQGKKKITGKIVKKVAPPKKRPSGRAAPSGKPRRSDAGLKEALGELSFQWAKAQEIRTLARKTNKPLCAAIEAVINQG